MNQILQLNVKRYGITNNIIRKSLKTESNIYEITSKIIIKELRNLRNDTQLLTNYIS